MSRLQTRRLAPIFALLLAGGALAAMAIFPGWLPAVAVAAVVVLAGAAPARRGSRRLGFAVAATALLLTIGLAGAWLLRAGPVYGFAWTILVLFAVPLPLVPLLYWLTFESGVRGPGSGVREESGSNNVELQQAKSGPDPGPRSPVPGSFRPDPGPRIPDPGREGGP